MFIIELKFKQHAASFKCMLIFIQAYNFEILKLKVMINSFYFVCIKIIKRAKMQIFYSNLKQVIGFLAKCFSKRCKCSKNVMLDFYNYTFLQT